MEVVFDPEKNAANIVKHGISLDRAQDFDVDAAFFDWDDSQDYGEVRYNAISWIAARLYTLTFTLDGVAIRAVSLRKATKQEQKLYAEAY